ncbi:hypothetical protein OAF37_01260, partial [Rubripirellula sp.]|nr:hypothetical protein [Rubripirellula sp.]
SKVYLDTSYLRHVKGEGFVNAEYVTSALRQQIVAAGCLIQDANVEAEIVIEARIGTLGQDDHRVTFGVPETNVLASAAALIPGAPAIPRTGELAFARREAREAAVKVAAFAYDRETRTPIWQSGVDSSLATATDTWVMGIGPFQGGTVREQTKLAGSGLKFGQKSATGSPVKFFERPPVDYTAEMRFQKGVPIFEDGGMSPDMIGISSEEIDRKLKRYEADEQIAAVDSEVGGASGPDAITPESEDEVTPMKSNATTTQVAASEDENASEKKIASVAATKSAKQEDTELEIEVDTEVPGVENGTKVANAADAGSKKNLK